MVESLMELPLNNLALILSKLPIKTIHICRCVCKTFIDLTSKSNPYFTVLHSSKPSTQNLIIQFNKRLNYVHFIENSQLDTINPGEKVRVSTIFKTPKIEKINYYYSSYYSYRTKREDYKYALVNACNGLIYFAIESNKQRSLVGNITNEQYSLVCNPITNEYVKVPEVEEERKLRDWSWSLWLGFSPVSRVYKVLRIYSRFTLIGAQIHDVRRSNNSWRDVESTTPLDDCIYKDNSYAFMNGIGYWLCLFGPPRVANFIVFFDFENEVFGRIDAPPSFDEYRLKHLHLMSIGVLHDCLSLIDNTESLDIWMLNECGQWIKRFSSVHVVDNPLFRKRLRPLQLLSSTGEILMVSNDGNLVCYDMKRNSFRLINFYFHTMTTNCNVVNFVPSFVPLKDALMGN